MEEIKKWGGRRTGSGQKSIPTEEKKINVPLYVKNKDVESLGGKEGVKEICYSALREAGADI